MEKKNLTEYLKTQYALGYIEGHIMTLCERCVDDSLDNATADKLLEALLHREQLLKELKK